MEFIIKCRLEIDKDGVKIPQPSKKKQVKLIEELNKTLGKLASENFMKELKITDPNFLTDTDGSLKFFSHSIISYEILNLRLTETPLSLAVQNEDLDMINILVDNGAYLDYRMGIRFDHQSVLHLAATQGKFKSLRKLLDLNMWIDAPNGSHLTALYNAALGGHTEACLRLLIAGASPNVSDDSGRTPLHIVIFFKYERLQLN